MSQIKVSADIETTRQIDALSARLTSFAQQVHDETDIGQKYIYAHRLQHVCDSAVERCEKSRNDKIDAAVKKNTFRNHVNHSLMVGGVMAGLFLCAVNFIPVGIAAGVIAFAAGYAGEKGKGPLAASPDGFARKINHAYQSVIEQAQKIRQHSSAICENLERNHLAELSASTAIARDLRFLPDLTACFAQIGLKTLSDQPHYKDRNKDVGYNIWLKPHKKTNS